MCHTSTLSHQAHPTRRLGNKTAFTLIELLVVISIIGLLVALLLPALASARESAINVQCLSNLRQVGVSVHAYATDHDGWFWNNQVSGDGPFWAEALSNRGYNSSRESMECPTPLFPNTYEGNNWRWGTYGMAGTIVASRTHAKGYNLHKVEDPSITWMGGDTISWSGATQTYRVVDRRGALESYGGLHLRHSNGNSLNLLFAGGHAAAVQPTSEMRRYISVTSANPYRAEGLTRAMTLNVEMIILPN